MMNKKKILVASLCCIWAFTSGVYSIVINRAIVSSDENPLYLDFWPTVAKAWQQLNIRPTLVLIANSPDVKIDRSCGDVIVFPALSDLNTGYQAQVIRLLVPALFPEDVCILSDIDMIPINKDYFITSLKDISEDNFVIFRDGTYGKDEPTQGYPLCYNAAKGHIFSEIFGVNTINDFSKIMREWSTLNIGWTTDEVILFRYVNNWAKTNPSRCSRLGRITIFRLNRTTFDETHNIWHYDQKMAENRVYIDCHAVRPYKKYASHIDKLCAQLGFFSNTPETKSVSAK